MQAECCQLGLGASLLEASAHGRRQSSDVWCADVLVGRWVQVHGHRECVIKTSEDGCKLMVRDGCFLGKGNLSSVMQTHGSFLQGELHNRSGQTCGAIRISYNRKSETMLSMLRYARQAEWQTVVWKQGKPLPRHDFPPLPEADSPTPGNRTRTGRTGNGTLTATGHARPKNQCSPMPDATTASGSAFSIVVSMINGSCYHFDGLRPSNELMPFLLDVTKATGIPLFNLHLAIDDKAIAWENCDTLQAAGITSHIILTVIHDPRMHFPRGAVVEYNMPGGRWQHGRERWQPGRVLRFDEDSQTYDLDVKLRVAREHIRLHPCDIRVARGLMKGLASGRQLRPPAIGLMGDSCAPAIEDE